MTEFTPYSALLGGILLGLSGFLLLFLNGRIAGITGIVANLFFNFSKKLTWQIYFLIGLVLGPLVVMPFGFNLPTDIDLGWPAIIIGGFLVGFGSRMGSGCTSGHGICGMGRFSPRSIIATISFMSAGIVTVFVIRHLLGV
ncbi:MAG: YeeE/YedE family protein [Thalassotalea sp.]|nr:YeeE/YedE family protein [Thalassotalea sp.]MDG2394467.1 YeeE/YedE family protein [Thalassotalea sp.]